MAAAGGARPVWECAVSLDFLLHFAAGVPPHMSTSEVVESIVKPATREARCRYVDLVSEPRHVGSSTYFISHRWGCNFCSELVEVLQQRFGAGGSGGAGGGARGADAGSSAGGPGGDGGSAASGDGGGGDSAASGVGGGGAGGASSPYLWLDIFAVNQHPNTTQADDLANLQNVIRYSSATVMLLDPSGFVLTRIWCLYEAWKTAEFKGAGGLQVLAPTVNYDALEEVFVRLDVQAAEATVESDRTRILAEVAASMGAQQLNLYIKNALVQSCLLEAGREVPAAEAVVRALMAEEEAAAAAAAAAGAAGPAASAEAGVVAGAGSGAIAAGAAEAATAGEAAAAPEEGGTVHEDAGAGGRGMAATAADVGAATAAAAVVAATADARQAAVTAAGGAATAEAGEESAVMLQASGPQAALLMRAGLSCFKASRMMQFIARLPEAESLMREATVLFGRVAEMAGRHWTLRARRSLGGLLLPQQGREGEAKAVLLAARDDAIRAYGQRHHVTVEAVNDIALLLTRARDWSGAEQLWRWCLEVIEEQASAMSAALREDALRSMGMNLGVALVRQGRLAEGEAALRSCLQRHRRDGGGHPDPWAAECLGQLAVAVLELGRPAEAEQLGGAALAMRRQIYGDRHPSVADDWSLLVRALAAQGRLGEALELLDAAARLSAGLLGRAHALTVRILSELRELVERVEALQRAAAAAEGGEGGGGPQEPHAARGGSAGPEGGRVPQQGPAAGAGALPAEAVPEAPEAAAAAGAAPGVEAVAAAGAAAAAPAAASVERCVDCGSSPQARPDSAPRRASGSTEPSAPRPSFSAAPPLPPQPPPSPSPSPSGGRPASAGAAGEQHSAPGRGIEKSEDTVLVVGRMDPGGDGAAGCSTCFAGWRGLNRVAPS